MGEIPDAEENDLLAQVAGVYYSNFRWLSTERDNEEFGILCKVIIQIFAIFSFLCSDELGRFVTNTVM